MPADCTPRYGKIVQDMHVIGKRALPTNISELQIKSVKIYDMTNAIANVLLKYGTENGKPRQKTGYISFEFVNGDWRVSITTF